MEKENLFEKIIYLSKVSLDLTLLQYNLINELIDKLEKYEDVTEYKKLISDVIGDPEETEEKEEETEDAE